MVSKTNLSVIGKVIYYLQKGLELLSHPNSTRTLSILSILVIVTAIPLTVYVAQQQQNLQQRADFECVEIRQGGIFIGCQSPCTIQDGACIAPSEPQPIQTPVPEPPTATPPAPTEAPSNPIFDCNNRVYTENNQRYEYQCLPEELVVNEWTPEYRSNNCSVGTLCAWKVIQPTPTPTQSPSTGGAGEFKCEGIHPDANGEYRIQYECKHLITLNTLYRNWTIDVTKDHARLCPYIIRIEEPTGILGSIDLHIPGNRCAYKDIGQQAAPVPTPSSARPTGTSGGDTGQDTGLCNGGLGIDNNNTRNPVLNATWNLSESNPSHSCNVYITKPNGEPIQLGQQSSAQCRGGADQITLDSSFPSGNYTLYVSNGTPSCENNPKNTIAVQIGTAAPGSTTPGGTGGSSVGDCRDLRPSETRRRSEDPHPLPDSEFIWKAFCSTNCVTNSQCPKNEFDDYFTAQSKDATAWCYGFDSGSKCLQLQRNVCRQPIDAQCRAQAGGPQITTRPLDGPPAACDTRKVNLRVVPDPVYANNQATFIVEAPPGVFDYQGSTHVDDTSLNPFTDCNFNEANTNKGIGNSKQCRITAISNFTWTHKWRNCNGGNCSSTVCEKSITVPVVTGTPPQPPQSPTNLAALCTTNPTGPRTVRFAWSSVPGAVRYAFRLKQLSTGQEVVSIDNLFSPEYEYTVLAGQEYDWWVHSVATTGRYSEPATHASTRLKCDPAQDSRPTNTPIPSGTQGLAGDFNRNGELDVEDLAMCRGEIRGNLTSTQCLLISQDGKTKPDILDWNEWLRLYREWKTRR